MLGAARVARACVLLLAFLCSFACQALVGGFDVSDQGESGCDDNRFRCVNELLYCVRTEGGEEALTLITRCNAADECDSAAGRCTVCEVGEFRCNREKVESCNATQSGWNLKKPCESAELCNVASGDCRTCAAGEVQCSGSDQRELQICSENGTWGPAIACDTKELCNASAAAIVANPNAPKECLTANCPPNAYQCVNDVELQRCPAGQAGWVTTDRCASPELCRISAETPGLADANGTKCEPPVCQPNDFRCTGNTLEQCNQDLLGFGFSEECVAPLQCNTNLDACTDACTPGEGQCNGNVVEVCNADQTWEAFEECENAGLCQATPNPDGTFSAACNAPQCEVAGAFQCVGHQLQQCRPDRSGWDSTPCASEALCNAQDGVCEPQVCADAGTFRCNPTQPLELQVCRADFTGWDSVQVCASTQSCNPSGTPPCIDECPNPPYRCTGNIREVCSGDTGAPVWTAETTCPTEELCRCALSPNASECLNGVDSTGRCGNPACDSMPPTVRCSGDFLETCQPGRNGWSQTDCTIDCMDSSTGPDYCALCQGNDAECSGTAIRYCNTGTGLYDPATSCPLNACMTVNGGPDYCAQCSAGNVECVNSTQIRTCNGPARRWNNPTNCALGCRDIAGTDYCAECSPGDAECAGNQLRTCDANTRKWVTSPCASPGVCMTVSDGPDYCAVCSAGDVECSGDDLRTCNATTRQWTTSTCDLACMTVSGADYCAECTDGDAPVCDDDELETCNATTRRWVSAPCSLGCMPVSGGADYCAECSTGDPAECSGDDLRTCDAGRWSSATCTLACMVEASGPDYCAQCSTGDARCVTGGLETCDSMSRRWGTAASCEFGCYGTAPGAYCGDCDGPEDCTSPTALCVSGRCEEPVAAQ